MINYELRMEVGIGFLWCLNASDDSQDFFWLMQKKPQNCKTAKSDRRSLWLRCNILIQSYHILKLHTFHSFLIKSVPRAWPQNFQSTQFVFHDFHYCRLDKCIYPKNLSRYCCRKFEILSTEKDILKVEVISVDNDANYF